MDYRGRDNDWMQEEHRRTSAAFHEHAMEQEQQALYRSSLSDDAHLGQILRSSYPPDFSRRQQQRRKPRLSPLEHSPHQLPESHRKKAMLSDYVKSNLRHISQAQGMKINAQGIKMYAGHRQASGRGSGCDPQKSRRDPRQPPPDFTMDPKPTCCDPRYNTGLNNCEFRPTACHNPLVVRSKVYVPYESSRGRPPTGETCPVYRAQNQQPRVKYESEPCCRRPQVNPSLPPPGRSRNYCDDEIPSDYVRNPITVTRGNVRADPCPPKAVPQTCSCESLNVSNVNSAPVQRRPTKTVTPRQNPNARVDPCPPNTCYSCESLNVRKVKSAQRQRRPQKVAPPRQDPRNCEPCNSNNGNSRRTLGNNNNCNSKAAQGNKNRNFREAQGNNSTNSNSRGPGNQSSCYYVPQSCFVPRAGNTKNKSNTETKRGRFCSGLGVKPSISIDRTKRILQSYINHLSKAPMVQGALPATNRPSSILKTRLSKVGLKKCRRKAGASAANTLSGSDCNIPEPCLIYPRFCGGKVTPTTSRVVKSRLRGSLNSMTTVRANPTRISESRRQTQTVAGRRDLPQRSHTPQPSSSRLPTRRDLPKRYQASERHRSSRSLHVIEEQAHVAPRRRTPIPAPEKTSSKPSRGAEISPAQSVSHGQSKSGHRRAKELEEAKSHPHSIHEVPKASAKAQSTYTRARVSPVESQSHGQSKSGPCRTQEATKNATHPDTSHSKPEESKSPEPREGRHALPRRVQEAENAAAEKNERPQHSGSAEPHDRPYFNPHQTSSSKQQDRPQHSGSAKSHDKPQRSGLAPTESSMHKFYQSRFLAVSPNQWSNRSRTSYRPYGSLITIAKHGKRSLLKGSNFIVPNKWQFIPKPQKFAGSNDTRAATQRYGWNWRKLCPNWLLNGKPLTFGAFPFKMTE